MKLQKESSTLRKLLFSATFMCLMATVSGEIKCKLRYDKRMYMEWYDFGSNIIYGMYDDAPVTYQDCERCDSFGN